MRRQRSTGSTQQTTNYHVAKLSKLATSGATFLENKFKFVQQTEYFFSSTPNASGPSLPLRVRESTWTLTDWMSRVQGGLLHNSHSHSAFLLSSCAFRCLIKTRFQGFHIFHNSLRCSLAGLELRNGGTSQSPLIGCCFLCLFKYLLQKNCNVLTLDNTISDFRSLLWRPTTHSREHRQCSLCQVKKGG